MRKISIVMPAPKKNKNASKTQDNLLVLIPLYIKHIAEGYSKEAFAECDYRTIETHLKDEVVLQSLKIELQKATRQSLKKWEQIGMDITTGKIRGNPATWIFTMKNKFPDLYKDRQEVAQDVKGELTIVRKVING